MKRLDRLMKVIHEKIRRDHADEIKPYIAYLLEKINEFSK